MLSIAQAAQALRKGAVIAYPTEAVYGLGCDPMNEAAVARIWQLKKRPAAMGLILIASDWQQLAPYVAQISEAQQQQLDSTWPGPHTWIVPAQAAVPTWLTGGRDSVAVRMSDHAPSRALCDAFGGALVSTSANLHGQPPLRDPLAAERSFHAEGFAGVMQGELGGLAQPTSIRDLRTGEWVRR
jgi:L-threonylcarbamoyladenylate synthase